MKRIILPILFFVSTLIAGEDNQRTNNSKKKVFKDAEEWTRKSMKETSSNSKLSLEENQWLGDSKKNVSENSARWLRKAIEEDPSIGQLSSDDKKWLDNAKNNVSTDATAWLREAMSEELAKRQQGNIEPSNDSQKECQNCVVSKGVEPKLYVFVSFSMPAAAWLSLSKDAALVDGVFVLQGLPDNSFRELSEKILAMKKKGFSAEVQINPKLFEDYAITAVPAFVVIKESSFDKVSGNISIPLALDLIEQYGETGIASSLKNLFFERKEVQVW